MDTINILKSILSGNATGSKRIEDIRHRQGGGGGSGGGLGDILGSILGGGGGGGGGGGRQSQQPESSSPGDVGGMLEELLGVGGASSRQPAPAPVPEPRRVPSAGRSSHRQPEDSGDHAALLISAMCNAAKVDGEIDKAEQDAILGRLGDVSREAIDFVRRELGSPLDLDGYCRSVPSPLAQQAYAFSVMAIKLDSLSEAAFLGRLGSGLHLDPRLCNQIHRQIGAPCLYA